MRPVPLFSALMLAALAAALAGCAVVVVTDDGTVHASGIGQSGVSGNGQYASENRSVAAVDRLELQGAIVAEVRVGAAPSLRIEADANLLPLVRTESVGGTLKVWLDGEIRSGKPVRLVLTTPALTQVQASGSGRLTISGLHGGPLKLESDGSRKTVLAGSVGRLDLRLRGSGGLDATALGSGSTDASVVGSGRLVLGDVRGDLLQVETQGSGGVRASGAVQTVRLRLAGSGGADLIGLASESADVRTQGSGNIVVAVARTLVVDNDGSAYITVHGDPDQHGVRGRNVHIVR